MISASRALLFSAAVASAMLWSLAARANCQSWQLPQKFNALQADGPNVVFNLGQVINGKVSGSAHYYGGADWRLFEGRADGIFDGKRLTLFVWWSHQNKGGGHPYGEYKGQIDSNGNLAGVTKDLQNSRGTNPEIYWRSTQTLKCANPFCDGYTTQAVAAAAANAKLKCGNKGPRWSADANLHRAWCVANQALANSENAARTVALDNCDRSKVLTPERSTGPSPFGSPKSPADSGIRMKLPSDRVLRR